MTRAVRFVPLSGAALEQDGVSPETVGMKAYNLMRIAASGMRVPPGFVVGTSLCRDYFDNGNRLSPGFKDELRQWMERIDKASGRHFGGARHPLLVSVRSGAAQSMPGMLETVLNVGLNDTTVKGLVRATGNPRMAWDCYRRLVFQFATVVLGIPAAQLERIEAEQRAHDGIAAGESLDWNGLRAVTKRSLDEIHAITGKAFPADPIDQLTLAIEAVFRSWTADKAREYRNLHHLDDSAGTAVTVQAMVFGNAGGMSGSGVGFTRNPATGEKSLYMDFLYDAQGEDVVSGRFSANDSALLERTVPALLSEVHMACDALETEFRDLQDFEFTVENGALYVLQSRDGKRTPLAALRIAIDQVAEGLISAEAALERLAAYDVDGIELLRLVKAEGQEPLARATPASTGVAVGRVVVDTERAKEFAAQGKPVILVRHDIATEDIAGIAAAQGILTVNGARTSHAAVVARQMGKVCLIGCPGLRIDPAGRGCTLGGQRFDEGSYLSLDGESGDIYEGRLTSTTERPTADLATVAAWKTAVG